MVIMILRGTLVGDDSILFGSSFLTALGGRDRSFCKFFADRLTVCSGRLCLDISLTYYPGSPGLVGYFCVLIWLCDRRQMTTWCSSLQFEIPT